MADFSSHHLPVTLRGNASAAPRAFECCAQEARTDLLLSECALREREREDRTDGSAHEVFAAARAFVEEKLREPAALDCRADAPFHRVLRNVGALWPAHHPHRMLSARVGAQPSSDASIFVDEWM